VYKYDKFIACTAAPHGYLPSIKVDYFQIHYASEKIMQNRPFTLGCKEDRWISFLHPEFIALPGLENRRYISA
jgi:hypothetical protein